MVFGSFDCDYTQMFYVSICEHLWTNEDLQVCFMRLCKHFWISEDLKVPCSEYFGQLWNYDHCEYVIVCNSDVDGKRY
jgi:hypothetical protein